MSFVERQEGRALARSMLISILDYNDVFFETSGAETVIHNLELTVAHHRGDYAKGINDILCIARQAADVERK